MADEPTVSDIDEALTYLRDSIRNINGDPHKRQVILDYMDELLDSRSELCGVSG